MHFMTNILENLDTTGMGEANRGNATYVRVRWLFPNYFFPRNAPIKQGVCKSRNTPEHPGTPRNTPGTARNSPEQPWNTPGTSHNTPEHPIMPRNTLNTARNTLEHQK